MDRRTDSMDTPRCSRSSGRAINQSVASRTDSVCSWIMIHGVSAWWCLAHRDVGVITHGASWTSSHDQVHPAAATTLLSCLLVQASVSLLLFVLGGDVFGLDSSHGCCTTGERKAGAKHRGRNCDRGPTRTSSHSDCAAVRLFVCPSVRLSSGRRLFRASHTEIHSHLCAAQSLAAASRDQCPELVCFFPRRPEKLSLDCLHTFGVPERWPLERPDFRSARDGVARRGKVKLRGAESIFRARSSFFSEASALFESMMPTQKQLQLQQRQQQHQRKQQQQS